jgi:hypothetical protein
MSPSNLKSYTLISMFTRSRYPNCCSLYGDSGFKSAPKDLIFLMRRSEVTIKQSDCTLRILPLELQFVDFSNEVCTAALLSCKVQVPPELMLHSAGFFPWEPRALEFIPGQRQWLRSLNSVLGSKPRRRSLGTFLWLVNTTNNYNTLNNWGFGLYPSSGF